MGRPDWSQWRPYAWGGLVLAALAILLSRPYHSPWLGEGGPEEAPVRRYSGGQSSTEAGQAGAAASNAAASPGLAPPEPALVNALRHSYSGNAAPESAESSEALADAAGSSSGAPGRANANLLSGLGGGASSGARMDAARAAAAQAAAQAAGGSAASAAAGSRAQTPAGGPSAPDSAGSRASSAAGGSASGGAAGLRGPGSAPNGAGPSTGFAAGGGGGGKSGGLGGEARGMGGGSGGGGGGGGDSGGGSFSPGGLSAAKDGAAPPDVKSDGAAGAGDKGGGAAGGGGGAGGSGGAGGATAAAGGSGASGGASGSGTASPSGGSPPSPFMSLGGAAGPSGAQNAAADNAAPVEAESGTPNAEDVLSQRMFARKRGEAPSIPVKEVATPNGGKAVLFTGKMAIDADGAGDAWKGDRTGQGKTSLKYRDGGSLNPSRIPFVVVPGDFHQSFPTVALGDYAAVSYKGKTAYAIIGDHGPKGVVGEGSIALARALGINADPNRGGADSGVQYLIFPQTRDAEPPRDAQAIQERGRALRAQTGVQLAVN